MTVKTYQTIEWVYDFSNPVREWFHDNWETGQNTYIKFCPGDAEDELYVYRRTKRKRN